MTDPALPDEGEAWDSGPPDSIGNPSGETRRLSRRLLAAWIALAVVVAGVGSYALSRSELLDVDEVRVVGPTATGGWGPSPEDLVVATGVKLGSPLLGVDATAVERMVADDPWVAAVEVDRRWPGTVEVWVRQREATANAVDPAAAVALLDAEGTVLEHRDGPVGDLPVVRVERLGRAGTRMAGLTPLLRAVDAVPAEVAPWIVALVPSASGVVAELVGGAEAVLGLGEDYHDEFHSLATVLARVELACIVEIDVSLHASPVVRRDEARCG